MYQAVGDCKHGQQKEEQNEHNTLPKPKEAQLCASPTVTEGDLALQEVLQERDKTPTSAKLGRNICLCVVDLIH